jgi:hypothetical protein
MIFNKDRIKRLLKWEDKCSNEKNKRLDLNYHLSRSTLLGIIVKSRPALFMKNGISLKFPLFVGHFKAASGMKETSFKHCSNWKLGILPS